MNRRDFVNCALGALFQCGCSHENAQDAILAEFLSEFSSQMDPSKAIAILSTTFMLSERIGKWKTALDIQVVNPKIQESTAASLLSIGSTTRPVSLSKSSLPAKLSVFHVAEQDFRRIFEKASLTGGWQQFYREFPNATGLLSFSSVGFNDANDQAAFVLSFVCGGLCGSGSLVLMKRSATGWHLEDSSSLWVS